MRENRVFLKSLENKEVAIYSNYASLENGESVMLAIQILASNNFIVATSVNILLDITTLSHKRFITAALDYLIEKGYISVDGDYSKVNNTISIEVLENDFAFGLVNAKVALDMCKDLNKKELNVAFALYCRLNKEGKNNYVYPSIEQIAKDMCIKDHRYIKEVKSNLIEKGYIKKCVPIFNKLITRSGDTETNIKGTGSTLMGYFLRTDKNEVDEESFADDMINKQNKKYFKEGSKVRWSLSSKEYISKYKHKDKYITSEYTKKAESVDFWDSDSKTLMLNDSSLPF